jgi:hypothetical protein
LNSGVFLQISREDEVDLPVPGQKYSFGVVLHKRGDFQVLADPGRRALRVHLGKQIERWLSTWSRQFGKLWLEFRLCFAQLSWR